MLCATSLKFEARVRAPARSGASSSIRLVWLRYRTCPLCRPRVLTRPDLAIAETVRVLAAGGGAATAGRVGAAGVPAAMEGAGLLVFAAATDKARGGVIDQSEPDMAPVRSSSLPDPERRSDRNCARVRFGDGRQFLALSAPPRRHPYLQSGRRCGFRAN